jgi:hypothetical protein
VAIHGERIAVGAPREDVAPGCVDVNCNSGTAYLFERNEGGADTWGRVRTLDPGVTAPGDQFGSSLALDGDLLVVGAPTRGAKGVAFVFERDEGGAGSWGVLSQLAAIDAEMIPPTYPRFGDSVGISGDLVVVGMPLQSSGSAYAFGRDVGGPGAWGHVQKVTGSDVLEYDGFGTAVAISGDTIVAGAPRHSAAGSRSGTAYVFDVTETGGPGDAPLAPDEVDQAVATDGADGDLLGAAIAISGSTMVVGAPDDDGGAGSAYVFRRDPGGEEWSQVRKLVGAATADRFGSSVAIDGDTIAVGAPESDEAAACSGAQCDAGSVYVFDRDFEPEAPLAPVSDNWGLVTRLEAADADAGDRFGAAVAIDRGRIVAGAPADDDAASCLDASCDSGSVYLFERNHDSSAPSAPSPEAWGQRRKLTLSAGVAQDRFGSSVAIDGDTLAVGAPGGSTGVAGNAAYVFTRNTGGADAWGEAGRLIADDASTGDAFGVSVGVSRDRVVVGAPRDGNASGSAYLFERNAGGADAWGQLAKLTATDADSGDRFGTAVAIAADTVAIGAWQDYDGGTGSQSGSAYVFERNTSGADAWGQLAKLTASDAAMADSFGVALAFSGRTLAIGASVALADEIGVPAGPGAAYVFETRAPETDLIVSVTDFLDEVAPGQTLVYGVSVDNLGPAPSGATVVSRFPTNALTSCSWVCTTLGNAWCGTQGPVGGDVQDTGVLAVGGGLRYWVTCRIRSDALGLISSPVLALTASPTLDSDPSNNLATDVDSLPPAGDCGPFAQDLFLADQSHDGAVSFRACDTIVAGPSFTVESGGSVSLCAGASIRLGSGFQVAANGSFRATTAVDPVSCP